MLYLEETRAKSWTRCVCCGEQIVTAEKFFVVMNEDTGKAVRSERYCNDCYEVAFENNEGLRGCKDDCDAYRSEGRLRSMDDYASYDNKEAYWHDRNNGYAH